MANKIALAVLGSEFIDKKNAEMSQLSQTTLKKGIDLAIQQAVRKHDNNPFLDLSTCIYYEFNAFIEILTAQEGPLIFFIPENIVFNTPKNMSKIRILLIQPKPLGENIFETKDTSTGKLYLVKTEQIDIVKGALTNFLDIIKKQKPDFVCLPELSFVNDKDLKKAYSKAALDYDCFIIGGSFHDDVEEANKCLIFCPNGKIVVQRKIFRSKELGEGIKIRKEEAIKIVNYGQGRFSSLICLDAESEKIRDVLKERLLRCKCPELIFNPSYTTAISRAHSQLKDIMSLIFAGIIFCNEGSFGGSCVVLPQISQKNCDFKKIEIKPSKTKTVYEIIELDISTLQDYKKIKVDCLIAMKE